MHQFSEGESQTKVPWSAIILKIVIFIRICMVNGQGLPVQLICHTKPWWRFAILWCMTLTIGPLTNFGLLFPVVFCFCVWPSFIGAVLSVIKVYRAVFLCPSNENGKQNGNHRWTQRRVLIGFAKSIINERAQSDWFVEQKHIKMSSRLFVGLHSSCVFFQRSFIFNGRLPLTCTCSYLFKHWLMKQNVRSHTSLSRSYPIPD